MPTRFADLIRRQLDLFEEDERELLNDCEEAERAYDAADRDDAEEAYGDYMDLVDTGTEALAEIRDTYASTLDEETAEHYGLAFNQAVMSRFPRFGLEIEET